MNWLFCLIYRLYIYIATKYVYILTWENIAAHLQVIEYLLMQCSYIYVWLTARELVHFGKQIDPSLINALMQDLQAWMQI